MALRAGNEKDEDQADTVGCCSLRVEHLKLHDYLDDKEHVVEFDFLGKDSIRYYNKVQVEKRVFKNLQLFMENKSEGDDLFDRLNVSGLSQAVMEFREDCQICKWACLPQGGLRNNVLMIADCHSEQASGGSDGRTHCQGFPYLQCLKDSTGAACPSH